VAVQCGACGQIIALQRKPRAAAAPIPPLQVPPKTRRFVTGVRMCAYTARVVYVAASPGASRQFIVIRLSAFFMIRCMCVWACGCGCVCVCVCVIQHVSFQAFKQPPSGQAAPSQVPISSSKSGSTVSGLNLPCSVQSQAQDIAGAHTLRMPMAETSENKRQRMGRYLSSGMYMCVGRAATHTRQRSALGSSTC
jgi:hypothetical protein